MRKVTIVGLVLTGVLAMAGWALASSGYSLRWWVISGGGGRSSSGNYTLEGTTGQALTGSASSAHFQLGAGYWYGAAPDGAVTPMPTATLPALPYDVFLPAVRKG